MTATPAALDPTRTLASLVADAPERGAVFDHLGLDYCCHGQRSLADACTAAGLDTDQVTAEVGRVASGSSLGTPVEPAALVDHIEATHHAYLHTELPELSALAAKVRTVHGERHPELAAVERLVNALRTDLEPHLAKEERVLFPAVRALTRGQRDFPFMTIRNPVRMMTVEHDLAGRVLSELRRAAHGFEAPDDGCASYRSLYARLEQLERDTHEHIHLENNILFPAVIALEGAAP
jgi:regulator of cell morphogenesis and NO signaling